MAEDGRPYAKADGSGTEQSGLDVLLQRGGVQLGANKQPLRRLDGRKYPDLAVLSARSTKC